MHVISEKKLNTTGGVSVIIIFANNIHVSLRIMCGRRDTFLCGTVGDRVLLLANHQSLLWNFKADKILKLKFIVKFIVNA